MTRSRIGAAVFGLVLGMAVHRDAAAEPKYVGWTKVESSRDLRDLKEKLKDGGQLDANAKAFLEGTVLPQLELDENRQLIERTRKRIREVLLADVADDKAYGDIVTLVAESMTALARNEQAEPAVRVNAMLLVGELKAKDGKPWSAAAPALAAAAADKGLPDAVRIAALAGLARSFEKGVPEESVVNATRSAVDAILEELGPAGRTPEQEWLVSRAVQLVPAVAKPVPPKLAATLTGIVSDEGRPIDLRVRAAAALGAAGDANSGLDGAALVTAIRALAVTALESEEKAAEARRFETRYRRGGAPMPGMNPEMAPGVGFDGQPLPVVDPDAIPELACRRAAWRLYSLGTALVSADGKQGLVTLLGDAADPAKELAKQLTDEGMRIDQTPDEDALLAALDVLRPPEPGAKRPARQPQAEEPAPDGKKPATDPNASPFDNPFQ